MFMFMFMFIDLLIKYHLPLYFSNKQFSKRKIILLKKKDNKVYEHGNKTQEKGVAKFTKEINIFTYQVPSFVYYMYTQ
ncbi:hypothetical protein PFBG_01043 [Plasmodium falciparum 7G8]|uniref:Uncharacterized protein n=1 Tax=Plasmodium falciparum (isolate 7G8) TaxID=57266 RepID=W7FKJ4_PLAF8|nr:hypothetical protein PFBG_01043 [Plasmodium falciparum 7G8]